MEPTQNTSFIILFTLIDRHKYLVDNFSILTYSNKYFHSKLDYIDASDKIQNRIIST